MTSAGIGGAGDDFFENRHGPERFISAATIKPRPIGSERQFFANEGKQFLHADASAGARPGFRPAEMLHTNLKCLKPKVVSTGFDQGVDSLFNRPKTPVRSSRRHNKRYLSTKEKWAEAQA